jgi:hypothetical protein
VEEDTARLRIGNRIVLEKQHASEDNAVETVIIKGDEANLDEGILALRKGALVTEINMVLVIGDNEWRFTMKGESFHLTGLKTPEGGTVDSRDDIEGAVYEKFYLYDRVISFMETLYRIFLDRRLDNEWQHQDMTAIRNWIYS